MRQRSHDVRYNIQCRLGIRGSKFRATKQQLCQKLPGFLVCLQELSVADSNRSNTASPGGASKLASLLRFEDNPLTQQLHADRSKAGRKRTPPPSSGNVTCFACALCLGFAHSQRLRISQEPCGFRFVISVKGTLRSYSQ